MHRLWPLTRNTSKRVSVKAFQKDIIYLTVVKMDSCVESLFLVYICLNNGNKILPADVIKGRVYLWLSKNEWMTIQTKSMQQVWFSFIILRLCPNFHRFVICRVGIHQVKDTGLWQLPEAYPPFNQLGWHTPKQNESLGWTSPHYPYTNITTLFFIRVNFTWNVKLQPFAKQIDWLVTLISLLKLKSNYAWHDYLRTFDLLVGFAAVSVHALLFIFLCN